MQNWILDIMNKYGYFGVMFLIAVENIFPPIPSEVILTFGGFMTTYTFLNVGGVIIAATFGSVIGAVILYGVGIYLSPEHLGKLLDGKFGTLINLKKEDMLNACEWFNKKGKRTVLFCRCIPIIRSLISIPAGMAEMKMSLFLFYTTIGSVMWNTLLVCLGAVLGASWEKIVEKTGVYSQITFLVLTFGITYAAIQLVKKNLCKRSEKEQ
ncbi:membrane protein DedA with SNARE-associated domain [Lachnotalea glycerini]|uniref:DedA family protein n=1 Tax=Lachnotalea glycerini TaxID=1763509 RepID=A0A255ICN6_9FIRM|nr:DedA family protein [Lachnotalea glycerini]PXV86862.1 membrane protein DedA with SNARE-associated domain [Lachnotalea glycerini]RDY30661.1 DedA family protein [Lachnotalea glycerini]